MSLRFFFFNRKKKDSVQHQLLLDFSKVLLLLLLWWYKYNTVIFLLGLYKGAHLLPDGVYGQNIAAWSSHPGKWPVLCFDGCLLWCRSVYPLSDSQMRGHPLIPVLGSLLYGLQGKKAVCKHQLLIVKSGAIELTVMLKYVRLDHKSDVAEKCSISRDSAWTPPAAYCTCRGATFVFLILWNPSCCTVFVGAISLARRCVIAAVTSLCLLEFGGSDVVQGSGYWRLSWFLALYGFIVLYFVVTFKVIEEMLWCCNQEKHTLQCTSHCLFHPLA